jgi:phosphoribosylpyrophosphate synthetase
VFLIQPLVPPVQENLVELLLMADAARGASAARVTAVMPHYACARSDKKDEPRVSIGGRLVADLLVTAGVTRVLTLALHSPQVHGFFSVPVDHLHALRELATHFRGRDLSRATVVSPDLGYAKSAAAFARRLSLPVAAGTKERISDTESLGARLLRAIAGGPEGWRAWGGEATGRRGRAACRVRPHRCLRGAARTGPRGGPRGQESSRLACRRCAGTQGLVASALAGPRSMWSSFVPPPWPSPSRRRCR